MEEYISLKEAERHCPYSQDYLKLRARQGKLKAIKIGRNWATTSEWIKEYLRGADKGAKGAITKKMVGKKPLLAALGIILLTVVVFSQINSHYTVNVFTGYLKWVGENIDFQKIIPAKTIEIK